MDFLRTVRDAIHGLSEEARQFLAFGLMGVLAIGFFFVWLSGLSSRLVALGPAPTPAPAAAGAGASGLAGAPFQAPPGITPEYAQESRTLTPVQGLGDTLSGLERLFAIREDVTLLQSIGRFFTGGFELIRQGLVMIGEGLARLAEFLYVRLSPLLGY